jgi:hypothetical protein
MTNTQPTPEYATATFTPDALEATYDAAMRYAIASGVGITANLLADAFLDALDGERDTVTLGAVEQQALRAAVAATTGADREVLADAQAAFNL